MMAPRCTQTRDFLSTISCQHSCLALEREPMLSDHLIKHGVLLVQFQLCLLNQSVTRLLSIHLLCEHLLFSFLLFLHLHHLHLLRLHHLLDLVIMTCHLHLHYDKLNTPQDLHPPPQNVNTQHWMPVNQAGPQQQQERNSAPLFQVRLH